MSDATKDGSILPVAARAVGPVQKTLVHVLLALLFGLPAYCILKEKEQYPFSHFPMYARSYADDDVYEDLRIELLTSKGAVIVKKGEIARATKMASPRMVLKYLKRNDDDPEALAAAGRKLLEALREQRLSRRPDGPEVRGLRISREVFAIDRRAVDRKNPDELVLLYEFVVGDGAAAETVR